MDLSDAQIERYSRQILLKELGGTGQERILAGSVLVLGGGRVPALASLYLAAAGCGRLGLGFADGAEEARASIAALNPDTRTHLVSPEEVSREVIADYDVVAHTMVPGDRHDRLNRAWLEAARPMVVARVAGATGSVTTLRPGPGTGCLACMPWPSGEATTTPLAAPLAGAIASLQAIEVLKAVTGTGEPLHDRLVTLDAHGAAFAVQEAQRPAACAVCGAT
ncbi:MAG: ThiF family adenylyltransferase [Nitrospirota bacterium]|jgi:adenylyltransferase/sulfurtransferase